MGQQQPNGANEPSRWRSRFVSDAAMLRIALICWLTSFVLAIRVAYAPRFDQEFGFVAVVTGIACAVIISVAPRRPWSAAVGLSGLLLAVLSSMFIRA